MSATIQAFASGTPVVSPSAKWTGATNATGSNTSTTVATYTTAISAEVGTIQLAGYAMSTASMGAINSVDVQVWSYVTATNRWTSASAQLLDSAGVAIGAAQTLTLSATTTNSQTLNFTGVSLAQIAAGIQVKLSATKSGTTSNAFNVNAVGVVVNYAAIVPVPATDSFEVDTGAFGTSTPNTTCQRVLIGRTGSSSLRLIGSATQTSVQATGKFSGFTIGQQYTVTVWALPYNTTTATAPFADANLGVVGLSSTSFTMSSQWKQLIYTFTATATTHDIYVGSTNVASNSGYATMFDDFAIDVARAIPFTAGFDTDFDGFTAYAGQIARLQRGRTGWALNPTTAGTGTAQAGLAPVVGFVPGKQYTVSVWASPQSIQSTDVMPSFTISVSGIGSSASVVGIVSTYLLVTYTFTATSTDHEIVLQTSVSNGLGALFDDFSVVELLRTPPYTTSFDSDNGGFATTSGIVTRTSTASTGTNGLNLTMAAGAANGTAQQSQTFTGFVVGDTYVASIWASTSPTSNYTVKIGVTGLSNSSRLINGTTWQQISYSFVATSTTHELYFSTEATSTIGSIFDDFSLGSVPTVNAGADQSITIGSTFSSTASETGAVPTSRRWTVLSGPTDVGAQLSSGSTSVTYRPTVIGTYVLRYSATNAYGAGTDDLTLTVNDYPPTVLPLTAGFETVSDIAGFVQSGDLYSKAVRTNFRYRTGTYGFNLYLGGGTGSTATATTVVRGLRIGTAYTATIWVQNENSNGPFQTASLGVEGLSASSLLESNTYQQLTYTFTATSTTHNLYINTTSSSSYGAIFDDFTFDVAQVVTPPTGTGNVKVNIGGVWVAKPVKVNIGGVWVVKPAKYWNGTAWVVTPY